MDKIDDEMLEVLMAMSAEPARPLFSGARTISASIVGSECDAALAFTIRGFNEEEPTETRRRLYEVGNLLEPRVIQHMRSIGLAVVDRDPKTGRQFMLTSREGHVKAYLDGYIEWDDAESEPVEIKSMSDDRFKKVVREVAKRGKQAGVKQAEPKYYDQMQLIMELANRESCIFLVYNKSDSKYLAIRVAKDLDRVSFIFEKIDRVLDGGGAKISKDPLSDHRCFLCGHKNGACTKVKGQAKIGCQRCIHATPDVDKKWYCSKHKVLAPLLCGDFEFWQPPL
jgi:hypothetical protein